MEDLKNEIMLYLKDLEKNLENMNSFDEKEINEIYRSVHTLKGGVATLGMKKTATYLHSIENILNFMKNNYAEEELINLLYDSLNELIKALKLFKNSEEEFYNQIEPLMKDIELFSKIKKINKEPTENVEKRVDITIKEEESVFFRISIEFEKDLEMKFIKCFMIEKNLSEIGNIVSSNSTDIKEDDNITSYILIFQTFNKISRTLIADMINTSGIKNVEIVPTDTLINYYMNKYIEDIVFKVIYLGENTKNFETLSILGYDTEKIDISEFLSKKLNNSFLIIELNDSNNVWDIFEKFKQKFPLLSFSVVTKENNYETIFAARYYGCEGIHINTLDVESIKKEIENGITRTKSLQKK